jgi:hypothetical protein
MLNKSCFSKSENDNLQGQGQYILRDDSVGILTVSTDFVRSIDSL